MSFVISNKHRIHYRLSGERGPWLILYPPFILDNEAWDMSGYVQLLERDFRLMLIDPLGQGRSDSPEDPSCYTMESRVQNVLNVMQEVQMDYAHFFGVGLGGQVGFQMVVDAPNKVRSLITAAAHPYPRLDEIKTLDEGLDQLRSGNIEIYLQQWRSEEHLSLEQQDQILKGNPISHSIGLEACCRWKGVADHLESINISSLLFTCTSEPSFLSVREAGRRLRYGRYVILPKIVYSHGLWSTETIVEPMLEFIRKLRN